MNANQINLGKKLYLTNKHNSNHSDLNEELLSQLVDIEGEDQLYISSPMQNGSIKELSLGSLFSIAFAHDGNMYSFDGKIINALNENGMLFYKVSVVSNIRRIQRREYYRLPIHVPIIYHANDINGKEFYGQGMTKDISGGGLRFVGAHMLSTGENCSILLRLESDIELRTTVQVIRTKVVENKGYEVSVLFNDIDFKQREELIKYIFLMQRVDIKKQKQIKKS